MHNTHEQNVNGEVKSTNHAQVQLVAKGWDTNRCIIRDCARHETDGAAINIEAASLKNQAKARSNIKAKSS